MVNGLPISQACVNLGQVARRAHVGEGYFIFERDGLPVVGIINAEELEDLELRNPKIKSANCPE